MIRPPPRSTRSDTLFPSPTLFLSRVASHSSALIRCKTVFGIHTRSSVFGEESQQPGLVPDLDAEFLGFGQLAAGGLARDQETGLLRHAAGGLGAQRFELFLRLVAPHRGPRAGQDDGLALQRASLRAVARHRKSVVEGKRGAVRVE